MNREQRRRQARASRLLHPDADKTAQHLDTLDMATLQRLEFAGELPATVAHAMTATEAGVLALSLPPCRTKLLPDGRVSGFVLMPPEGAWPRLTLSRAVRDINGDGTIRAGATGHLVAFWHHATMGVMHRVCFRARIEGGAHRFADVAADCIGQIEAMEGVLPHLTGWQIGRG